MEQNGGWELSTSHMEKAKAAFATEAAGATGHV
jgi:hypothetical protein